MILFSIQLLSRLIDEQKKMHVSKKKKLVYLKNLKMAFWVHKYNEYIF